jgi:hypothetical protein
MDNKQLLAIEWTAAGRAMAKFKRWMVQKVHNIYNKSYDSRKEGVWEEVIDEETGEVIDFKFVEQEFEGYIQSFIGLIKELKKQGWSWTKASKGLSARRKENISKLLADLILYALMMFTVGHLLAEDDEATNDLVSKILNKKQSVFMKDLNKGMANSMSDIMPIQGLYQMLKGSPTAAAAISAQVAMNSMYSLGYFVTGDIDAARSAGNRTMQTFGAYRFGQGLYQYATDKI